MLPTAPCTPYRFPTRRKREVSVRTPPAILATGVQRRLQTYMRQRLTRIETSHCPSRALARTAGGPAPTHVPVRNLQTSAPPAASQPPRRITAWRPAAAPASALSTEQPTIGNRGRQSQLHLPRKPGSQQLQSHPPWSCNCCRRHSWFTATCMASTPGNRAEQAREFSLCRQPGGQALDAR